MNLITKSLSVMAALAAFAVPAIASAHPEHGGGWSGHERAHWAAPRVYERGWVAPRVYERGWVAPRVYERGWVAPRVYERGWVAPRYYQPRVYVAPRIYEPRRVYVAPRVYAPRAWSGQHRWALPRR